MHSTPGTNQSSFDRWLAGHCSLLVLNSVIEQRGCFSALMLLLICVVFWRFVASSSLSMMLVWRRMCEGSEWIVQFLVGTVMSAWTVLCW